MRFPKRKLADASLVAMLAGQSILFMLTAIFAASLMVNSTLFGAFGWDAGRGFLRLAFSLLGLGVMGGSARIILKLPRARGLMFFVDIIYGQVLLVAYLYLRSIVSFAFSVPGVCGIELWALIAFSGIACIIRASFRGHGREALRFSPKAMRHSFYDFVSILAWLLLLGAVFLQQSPRLSTPCSDTDVHAYLLKTFLNRGAFAFVSPLNSEVALDYPGGFIMLNGVTGLLSGLHPVQIVNIQPYLQWLLLLPAWMTVWSPRTIGYLRFTALFLLLLALGAAGFNPFFPSHRSLLTGTGRLAHTAILFFPALHLWLCRGRRVFSGTAGFFVPVSLAVSTCINPAHAVPAILATAVILYVVRMWRRHNLNEAGGSCRTSRAPWGMIAGVVVAVLMMAHDPCFDLMQRTAASSKIRWSKIAQHSPDTPLELSPVREWPGSAFMVIRRLKDVEVWKPWFDDAHRSGQAFLETGYLLLLLFAVFWIGIYPLKRGLHAGLWESGLFLVLMAFGLVGWAILSSFLENESLTGMLAHTYSMECAFQSIWILTGWAIIYPALIDTGPPSRRTWGTAILTSLVMIIISLWMLVIFLPDIRTWNLPTRLFSVLPVEATSSIRPEDIEAFEWMREHIGESEPVILPCHVAKFARETWLFPKGPAAGVGHYTNLRPVFFYGLCGHDYNEYKKRMFNHVKKLDVDWMREQGIKWVFDYRADPICSRTEMRSYFDKIYSDERIQLWRLK